VRSPEEAALTRIPPENTGAPHLEARKAEGCDECKRSGAWLLPGRSTPFKRQISPLAPRSVTGKVSPDVHQGSHLYDTGARTHVSCRLTRGTKKANHHTRSMQLPHGYAPLHFRGNQRSRRRTAAQGACNRPAVVHPFIFTETSGRKGEPPRRKRTTDPRLCGPSSSLQPATQHGGPGPHVMQPAHRLPGAEKSHRRSCQCHVFSGSSQRTEKISFQNQCSDSRNPAHGPTVTLSTKVMGQSTMGIGVAVGMIVGGPVVIASTGVQEQQASRQSDSSPTCSLASSPEAGPGGHCRYPELGLLSSTVQRRRTSYVARKDNTPQDASLGPDLCKGTPDPCTYKSGAPKKACRVPRVGPRSLRVRSGPWHGPGTGRTPT
jgi:hypothetical protein